MKRVLKWQKFVERLDALTESNGIAAWETAKIVSELLPMKMFHKSQGGKKEAEDKLQLYSGRFALGLNDMVEMFKRFPKEESWKDGRLDILRDETCRLVNSEMRQRQLAENGEQQQNQSAEAGEQGEVKSRKDVSRRVSREKYDSMERLCKEMTDDRDLWREKAYRIEDEKSKLQIKFERLQAKVRDLQARLRGDRQKEKV